MVDVYDFFKFRISTYRNLLIEVSLLFKLAFINYDDNKCFLFWMKANVL